MYKIIFFITINCIFTTFADRLASAPEPKNIFYNLPILETGRLTLRPVQPEDVFDLHDIYADPNVVKYLASELDKTIDDTKKWIDWRLEKYKMGKPTPWAIVLKETNHLIGLCGFRDWHPEHGIASLMYLEARKYWNHGYMTEALNCVLSFSFGEMGLNRIDSMVHPDNIVSIWMHQKFGFERIGLVRECLYYRGSYCDRIYYSLLKSSFMQ